MKFKIGDMVMDKTHLEMCEISLRVCKELKNTDAFPFPKSAYVTHTFEETCFGGCKQVMYQVESWDMQSRKVSETTLVSADGVWERYFREYIKLKGDK